MLRRPGRRQGGNTCHGGKGPDGFQQRWSLPLPPGRPDLQSGCLYVYSWGPVVGAPPASPCKCGWYMVKLKDISILFLRT